MVDEAQLEKPRSKNGSNIGPVILFTVGSAVLDPQSADRKTPFSRSATMKKTHRNSQPEMRTSRLYQQIVY